MSAIAFDFYGISILVDSQHTDVIEELRRDFAYFASEMKPVNPDYYWSLNLVPNSKNQDAMGVFPVFMTRSFRVYERHGFRSILYRDSSSATFDFKNGRGCITAARKERLRELAYLAILSRAGEALDQRGLHRVHALGLEHQGQAALVLLPSGGGKSSLALELLRLEPRVRFLSEDTPLVCAHGLVHPFALRWSLRQDANIFGIPENFIRPFARTGYGSKRLIDLEFFQRRLGDSACLRWIFLGRRDDESPAAVASASACSAAISLAENLIVGRGVPQMAEYMLGANWRTTKRLTPIALSRLKVTRRLLSQSSIFTLNLGQSPVNAAQTLLNFLNRTKHEA